MRMVDAKVGVNVLERSGDGKGESTQGSMTMGNVLEDEIEEKVMHSGQCRTFYSLVSFGKGCGTSSLEVWWKIGLKWK